ncbi:ATP-binding protein [Virgibacillus sp. YIM 98842]|uniref:ATP-binding protein n=1 Tax=Virgibacillus sp. YIM 98842 TaxID=2663533 RepID=UPI0013DC243E|nr:ATP-binding protein [Virgibacillus sp. YIM 98842]
MSEALESNHVNKDTIRPHIPKGTHPIETGKYLISTNEIDRMYQTVIKWIENRTPGAIIYGRPRLGKTRAISYLLNYLPHDFGENTPIYHIRCRKYKNPNENFFFEDLLNAVGHSIITTGKSNMKRTRLLRFLVERADFSGNNKIIFFIDDAQRLVEINYDWLMDLYNDLDHYGITLTTILVGQKELVHQRSAFISGEKFQIVGRFMSQEYQFKGITSLNDLKICLMGYDDYCEYPTNSNWSFTKYFFSDSFIRGYRLQHSAEELFQVFVDLRREYGLPHKVEIPMQYVTLTIEYALKRFGNNGLDVTTIEKSHWEEAINNSGYIQSELYQIH